MNEAIEELHRACVEFGHAIWAERYPCLLFVVVVEIVALAFLLVSITN